jgi:hypothetical protein
VRAHLGSALTPLALKALLIHRCYSSSEPQCEIGWGKVAESIQELIECDDSTACIIYQGPITAGSYIRAPIPVPEGDLRGEVRLSATVCFATDTDPQDPINYTRSGLDIYFRPHDGRKSNSASHNPKTRTLFSAGNLYAGEAELRRNAHKWETVMHVSDEKMRWSSLQNPCFDIHYNARAGGGKTSQGEDMRYALVVSLTAPKVDDLYDRIFRRYRTQLEPLKPIIEIPIRT